MIEREPTDYANGGLNATGTDDSDGRSTQTDLARNISFLQERWSGRPPAPPTGASSYGFDATILPFALPKGGGQAVTDHVITHRELDARLEALEERGQRRHGEVVAKIDLLGQTVNAAIDRISTEVRNSAIENSLNRQEISNSMDKLNFKIESTYDRVISDNKNNRWIIIITVIAAVLSAVAAIWTTNSNIMAAIDLGRKSVQENTVDGNTKTSP